MTNILLDEWNNLSINSFAAVIIAAKQVRRINQFFLAEREKEEEIYERKEPKPSVEALKSLLNGEIKFQYPEIKTRRIS